jgi:hypothetical protein
VIIQVTLFCFMVSACKAAADSLSKGYGFTAVWSFLLATALSAGGTLVLRRIDYRTPLAVGFLIGVSALMANLMLVVAVVSGSNLAMWGAPTLPSSESATQAFAVILFLLYSAFTLFVAAWRDILLPPPMAGQDVNTGLPPSQAAYGGSYDGGFSAGGGGGDDGAYPEGGAQSGPAVL